MGLLLHLCEIQRIFSRTSVVMTTCVVGVSDDVCIYIYIYFFFLRVVAVSVEKLLVSWCLAAICFAMRFYKRQIHHIYSIHIYSLCTMICNKIVYFYRRTYLVYLHLKLYILNVMTCTHLLSVHLELKLSCLVHFFVLSVT